MNVLKGHIALEGTEYAGKDTVAEVLLERIPNARMVREPGGTPVGEVLRALVRREHHVFQGIQGTVSDLSHEETLTLFMVSRSMLVRELEATAKANQTIIWNRCFLTSWVYQVLIAGVDSGYFFNLIKDLGIKLPEHVFILTMSDEEFERRRLLRGEETDPLGLDANRRRQQYLDAYQKAKAFWDGVGCRVHMVDTTDKTPERVAEDIRTLMQ